MEIIKWGQWIGKLSGKNSGSLIVNIDRDTPNTGGIYFSEIDRQLSSYNGIVTFSRESEKLIGTVEHIVPINSPDQNRDADPKRIDLVVIKDDVNSIEGQWSADNGQSGEFHIHLREGTLSSVKAESIEWLEFIKVALEEKRKNKSLIFRGQSDSTWPLRTSFHRTNRRDLSRFAGIDMPELNQYLTLSGNRKFELDNAIEFAELMSLAQHHGYPTPLLDWSRSPLVAAFFAFRTVTDSSESGSVRVFFFDYSKWESEGQKYRSLSIDDPRYSITTLQINSLGNSRVLPQQSLFTFTNLTDIERWITLHEQKPGELIKAYDINKTHVVNAMNDLDNMNINAASLFPGLDGSFEALKGRRFRV